MVLVLVLVEIVIEVVTEVMVINRVTMSVCSSMYVRTIV